MKTAITFEKADYEVLGAAQDLAESIYMAASNGSELEEVAEGAMCSLAHLRRLMELHSTEGTECPPCAGDCAECHCEGCVEDEPKAVTAEQLREKIAEAIGVEPKGVEVVTTPTGEQLLKALAEIFGA